MMGLRALVRDFLLKRQLRSIERPLFRLDKNIIAPQKILLLLPSLPEELKWVGTALRELKEMYHQAKFCLVAANREGIELCGAIPNAKFIVPRTIEIRWSGLPHRSFLEKVCNEAGNLLIDLAIKPDHFNACVAAGSGVPIRIGCYGSWGTPVYNLEIKTNYLQNEHLILKSLVDVLRSVRAGISN